MPAALPVLAGGASIMGGLAAKSMIVKGLMIAGGAMSVIGGLTGNKKLTQLGGLVGAVGGIGGALTGAFKGTASAAAGTTATGTTAAAAGPSAIQNMLSAPVGGPAFMQGTSQAIGGLNTVGSGTSGILSGAMNTGLVNLADTSGAAWLGGAADVAGKTGGVFSGLGDKLKGVGGFLKDNKELVKLGGDALSGAMDRKAQMDMLELQRRHAEAMKQKDFDLALQLEDEMRTRKSASITGLKPMDQTMRSNQQGGPVTQGYQSVVQPGGILARQWQGAPA